MKGKVFASLLVACLPLLAAAQSNDDLYFVPKKKAETKTETKVTVETAPKKVSNTTTVYAAPGSTVVVKDAAGKTRDIDEYNRRYTSRENTFTMENDTLYIQEKPYGERGEWVNGFEGSQDDYEYAMRIVRFRSPRYAIPVSSPLYWDVVYGALPSWEWNVYDDGLYAYVFPTFSNPLWWDWRWTWGVAGPRFGFSWGWSSWYYDPWYSPYWYAGYWGGYWGPYWHHPHPYWHHHPPYYAGGWGGAGWRPYGHRDARPGRYTGYTTSRHNRVVTGTRGGSSTRRGYSTSSIRRNNASTASRTTGRVVNPNSRNNGYSLRPVSTLPGNRGEATRNGFSTGTTTRGNATYVRPSSTIDRTGSSYNRPSSTRRSYNDVYNRNVNTTRSRSYNNTNTRSYNSSRSYNSNRSSFSSGSSRSSFNRGSTGGGSTRMRSGGGGGSSRRR